MKFVLYTPWISPHQIPLARELATLLPEGEFLYLYTEAPTPHQVQWGWDKIVTGTWCQKGTCSSELLESCDVLLTGVRDFGLMERRLQTGKITFYMSERWFKPYRFRIDSRVAIPSWVRWLVPGFRRNVRRLITLINAGRGFYYCPIGVHAMNEMVDLGARRENMLLWGYFVKPSTQMVVRKDGGRRVMVAGRPLPLKHYDDVERAVACVPGATLTHVQGVPGDEVRRLMRQHDIYVMSSDSYEGWGAVVSEALEEGMIVLGTYESGASATILPNDHLYHVGDVGALAKLIRNCYNISTNSIGEWSAKNAARKLLNFIT